MTYLKYGECLRGAEGRAACRHRLLPHASCSCFSHQFNLPAALNAASTTENVVATQQQQFATGQLGPVQQTSSRPSWVVPCLLAPACLPAANLCGDMVRAALKEPMKGKAKIRETIYFRQSLWKDGQPQKQGEQRRAGQRDSAGVLAAGEGFGSGFNRRCRLSAVAAAVAGRALDARLPEAAAADGAGGSSSAPWAIQKLA